MGDDFFKGLEDIFDIDPEQEKVSGGFFRRDDEIIVTIETAYDAAEHFNLFTLDESKEMYINLITELQKGSWSRGGLESAVQSVNSKLTREQINCVVTTELGRLLSRVKEHMAVRNDREGILYHWSGPLDDRTSPMCRFLQIGELTSKNIGPLGRGKYVIEETRGQYRYAGTYDFEELRPELPEWREAGWTMPELKKVVHQVWKVFHAHGLISTEMTDDWTLHIACRHGFMPAGRPTGNEKIIPAEKIEGTGPIIWNPKHESDYIHEGCSCEVCNYKGNGEHACVLGNYK